MSDIQVLAICLTSALAGFLVGHIACEYRHAQREFERIKRQYSQPPAITSETITNSVATWLGQQILQAKKERHG